MNQIISNPYFVPEKLLSRGNNYCDSPILLQTGIDLVHIPTFSRVLKQSPKLIDKIFLKSEQSFSINSCAANFAAKEAVIKACGQFNINLTFLDIQVKRELNGAPHVYSENYLLDSIELRISLSHHNDFAIAFAVACKRSRH